jgi:membrane protease YdiL (CAAX protease family)
LFIIAVAVCASYLAWNRWLEHRRPPELTGKRGLADLIGGIALGIALFVAVIAVMWAAGVYRFAGPGTTTRLGVGAAAALLQASLEETLFRGLLFRFISVVAGSWIALLATSVLFGAAHAFNPGATFVSSVAVGLEAGVLLGAAYILTGKLWLPIGIHAGWNFAEGSLFGMATSGGRAMPGLITGSVRGPTLLTGGPFGPEASIIAVIVCLAAATGTLWCVMRRSGLVEEPLWKRTATP